MTELEAKDPANMPPPRQVDAMTRVTGHVIPSGASNTVCTCDGRMPRDFPGGPSAWRVEHLGDAWPIPYPREAAEDLGAWMGRVSEVHVEAVMERDRLRDELDERMSRDAEPIPVVTPELTRAEGWAETVAHQVRDIAERYRRHSGFD